MSVLYDKIQALCSERSVSLYRMCDDLHITTAQVYSLKYGQNRKLQPAYIEAIADYFGVDPEYLFDDHVKEYSFISEGTINADSTAPVDISKILLDEKTEEEVIKTCVSLSLLKDDITHMISSIRNAFPSIYASDTPRYNLLKAKVLTRSGGKCERCGCEGKDLQFHHKYPLRFGFPRLCDEENLIALCTSCHYAVHGNPRGNREFIFNMHRDDY